MVADRAPYFAAVVIRESVNAIFMFFRRVADGVVDQVIYTQTL